MIREKIRAISGPDWLNVAIVVAVCIGVWLRLQQYLVRGALWLDEALLANSIVTRSPRALIFSPLEYNQLAPPGFLQAAKLSTLVFGLNEFALRLPAFIFSLLGVAVFALLARKVLTGSDAIFAVILFSVSAQLLIYSSQLKQYSGDAFAAAFITWAMLKLRESRYSTQWLVTVAVIGLGIVWISDTSVLILAGSGIGLGVLAWLERDPRGLTATAILAPIGLIAAAASIAGAFRRMVGGTSGLLQSAWGSGFMPPPWKSPGAAGAWLWSRFEALYSVNVGVRVGYGVPLGLAVLGVWSLWKRGRRDVVLIAITPIAVALIAGMARVYPFTSGRLTLFLIPALTVAIAAGVGAAVSRLGTAKPFAYAGLLLALISVPDFALKGESPSWLREDIRPVLKHVKANRRAGDRVYIYWGGVAATQFYAPKLGIDTASLDLGALHGDKWEQYVSELDELRGSPRVWFVMAHTGTPELHNGIIRHLDAVGRRLPDDPYTPVPGQDATVFLYDLAWPADSTVKPAVVGSSR